MVILWFGDNLLIYLRFAWEFLFTKTDTALLKNTGGIISMVSVPPGIQLGSLLASYRPLILEQELAHHSATGVFSIHTYPHLFNYPVSLIPALEGSQSQLHQLAVCHTGPRKGGTSLRTCLSVLQPSIFVLYRGQEWAAQALPLLFVNEKLRCHGWRPWFQ